MSVVEDEECDASSLPMSQNRNLSRTATGEGGGSAARVIAGVRRKNKSMDLDDDNISVGSSSSAAPASASASVSLRFGARKSGRRVNRRYNVSVLATGSASGASRGTGVKTPGDVGMSGNVSDSESLSASVQSRTPQSSSYRKQFGYSQKSHQKRKQTAADARGPVAP